MDRSGHADRAGRQAGRGAARHRGADARRNAGDRGLQPPLYRERRPLHDRDADVPVGYRDAEDHAGHLHSLLPSTGHRALRRTAAVRHRRAQIGARLLAQGVGRNGADGSARRGDRPLRRHPGAHRRRGRPDLAFDLRAGRRGQDAVLQRRAQGARPQGRSDLQGAREPGLGRPPAVVSRARSRGA